MALTNREWKAALNMYGPLGRIGASFINKDDPDDKKYVEQTDYSSFNPSAGSKSGVAGSKEVTRKQVEKDPSWLVEASEKITPVLKSVDGMMAGLAAGSLLGPEAGKLASKGMNVAHNLGGQEKTEEDNINKNIDTGLNGLNLWSDNFQEGTTPMRETGQPVPSKIDSLPMTSGLSSIQMNLSTNDMNKITNPNYNFKLPKY